MFSQLFHVIYFRKFAGSSIYKPLKPFRMKRIMPIRLAFLAGLLLVLSAGCKKKIDKLPDVSSLCSIQWISTPATEGAYDTLRFSYDNYGNPTTISRLETIDDAYSSYKDYTFWYDHERRLTDLIGTSVLPVTSGNGFDNWDKFYYTGGRVTLDSLFVFGIVDGTRPKGFVTGIPRLVRVSHYEYDAKGRINRVTDVGEAGGFTTNQSFTYNGDGNLVKIMQVGYYSVTNPPYDTTIMQFSGYDNKINVDRTHPIWQFLDRNYSVNNRFIADAYNEACLPTVISHRSGPSLGIIRRLQELGFLELDDPLTIHYSCELPGQGSGHGY